MRASIIRFLGENAALWIMEQINTLSGRRISFTNTITRRGDRLFWEICANNHCIELEIDAETARNIFDRIDTRLHIGNGVVMNIRNVDTENGLFFVGQLSW